MSLDNFCCPICKGELWRGATDLHCVPCGWVFPIVDGVPDFFISETKADVINQTDKTWLNPEIVEARDLYYRLCTRELKGMDFCMRNIGQRIGKACRILEVGMGTGHFTHWLAEVSRPCTEIFAFDFSWPIIEKAKINVKGLSEITIFRANARGLLPFKDGYFDVVFLRLVPLGRYGIPNIQAGYDLLQPGGWYFEAGWEPLRFETPPTAWAIQHGLVNVEHHEWRYWRKVTEPEINARQIELDYLGVQGYKRADENHLQIRDVQSTSGDSNTLQLMTSEYLLLAQKPM